MCSAVKDTRLYPRDTEIPPTFPNISKPQIIGHFSIDGNRSYHPDARYCRYVNRTLFKRYRKLDLNEGYENVVRKPESSTGEKIDHLLFFIQKNLQTLKCKDLREMDNRFLATNFVCFRGLLRLLMCSPYEYKDNWSILATKYRSTIYLCALETAEKRSQRENETDENKRILSYGFKFEQFLMSDSPDIEPNTQEPVIEAEEFCCMFKTKLMGHTVVYGAEMDGIELDHSVNLNRTDFNEIPFIELKVKLREEKENQRINTLRFKFRNWWCQCFLANIKKVLVGVRDRDGNVTELVDLDVRDIPKQVRSYWSPAVCLRFCGDFLQLVDSEMKSVDCPYTVYKFDYDPRSRESIKLSIFKNKNDFSFLPEWYVTGIERG